MLKIRLQRIGRKKKPTYRVIVSEHTKDTQAGSLEILGRYNPISQPKEIELNAERILYWISVGAQPSDTVRNLLIKEGIIKDKKKGKSVSISKKRQAKIDEKNAAAEEAKKAAEEEAKAAAEAEKAKVAEEAKAAEEEKKSETEPKNEEAAEQKEEPKAKEKNDGEAESEEKKEEKTA